MRCWSCRPARRPVYGSGARPRSSVLDSRTMRADPVWPLGPAVAEVLPARSLMARPGHPVSCRLSRWRARGASAPSSSARHACVRSSDVLGRVSSGAWQPPVSVWASYRDCGARSEQQRTWPPQVRCVNVFRDRRVRSWREYASSSASGLPAGPRSPNVGSPVILVAGHALLATRRALAWGACWRWRQTEMPKGLFDGLTLVGWAWYDATTLPCAVRRPACR